MNGYFTTPFPFHEIIHQSAGRKGPRTTDLDRAKTSNKDLPFYKVDMEESIRSHIRSLVLMRMGEFAYDRNLGFEMWDYDKQVFYHEREPYFEDKKISKGLLENQPARKHFKENLENLIRSNELRLEVTAVQFGFEKVDGNLSVYHRKIAIKVEGRIKSTGKILSPPFMMSIHYTPFTVESN